MKDIFNNPKKTVYAILLFIVLYFTIRGCESQASSVEGGPSILSGYGLVYTESLTDKWDVGLVMVSDQEWKDQSADNNGGFFVQRLVRYKRFQMGLGAAYWIATSQLIGSNVGYHLSIHFDLTDKWRFNVRHWSNAGATPNNRGQDLLTLGYMF